MEILYSSPGSTIEILLDLQDGYSHREDSLTLPIINQVFDPYLNKLSNFPQNMIRLDVGLYVFSFTISSGQNNIGAFILDLNWTNPNGFINQTFVQVNSNFPLGLNGGNSINID